MNNVLIVDDDVAMCRLLSGGLRGLGADTTTASSTEEGLHLFAKSSFDVVVTDLRMAGRSGIDLCRAVNDQQPDVPVVVMTAFGSLETAVQAIRAGAYDFVTKPFELDRLRSTVERALAHRQRQRRVVRLQESSTENCRIDGLIGKSRAMMKVHDLIDRVAVSSTTVLVRGESGTGKELVARAIHERSERQGAPFVAINCAAMPPTLLESELFGHVEGAFTDARSDRPGLFRTAAAGTLFLDEIGEMPLEVQPKLLRALQERAFRPVGSSEELPLQARIVTATNRDLEDAVREGSFREDLYYRIHVIDVEVPPLRDRAGDVLLLARHFIDRFATTSGKAVRGVTPPAGKKLVRYRWPGNVRELQNAVERAVILTRFSEITVDDLPERIVRYEPAPLSAPSADLRTLEPMEEIERRYALHVYRLTSGNKSSAARILGWNRKTLHRKLVSYGVIGRRDDESEHPG